MTTTLELKERDHPLRREKARWWGAFEDSLVAEGLLVRVRKLQFGYEIGYEMKVGVASPEAVQRVCETMRGYGWTEDDTLGILQSLIDNIPLPGGMGR